MKIYDRFNDIKIPSNEIIFENDVKVGMIIRYKLKKYVVIQTIKYTTGKQSIDVIPEEEHIKQSTMVNLHFNYVTLKEVENTLKNVYGFSLYKEEDKNGKIKNTLFE